MASDTGSARWPEVERLYHAALDCAPPDRPAFLDAAGVDPSLRAEVELLLLHDLEVGDFLERPAIEDAARSLVGSYGPLPAGLRLGDFEIIELVGAGGMGEVYRARDLRLEREVALKIVHRGDTPADADVARFEQEARAASGLTHPNVVTIYGVGEHADVAFIAMEFVRGQTLSQLLDAGRLPLVSALDLAVQIADAMAAAHESGVIHRDLKPDNVMVTADGRIKVLDFGIAKRARTDPEETGLVRGTAGYMSPEQASGSSTDHRTDQFSFGAVCYELVTGRRAFQRATLTETIQAVKSVALEPLRKANPELTPQLRSIVERCLERDPKDRYSSTSDLAAELRRARDRWLSEEDRRQARRRAWWLAGAATLSTAAAFSAWRYWPSGVRARSLAVLPFVNTDSDPAAEYLCDGLADTLMRRLSYLPGIAVQPRSAVFNFKNTSVSHQEAGRRLGVEAVLAGSVRVTDGRLLVDARLVDVRSGADLWTDRYQRAATDALAMQNDLARAIVTEGVRYPLDRQTRTKVERPPTDHADANDFYLRGLHSHRLGTEEGYLDARRWLQQAVALDPAFALAQTSLASTYTAMVVDGFDRPTHAWPAADRAVRRALEIDPDLPEAHSERSSSWFFWDFDWTGAESEWKRATDAPSSPTLPDLLGASAVKLYALGRYQDALALNERARTLDRLTPGFAIQQADLLLCSGRAAEAATVYESVIASHPEATGAYPGLAEAYADQRRFAEAIESRRRGYEIEGKVLPIRRAGTDEAAYRALDRAAAEAELEELASRAAIDSYVSPLDVARARVRLKDLDRAFHDLDAAFEEQSPGLVFLRVDRAWRTVHEDQRFVDCVTAMSFP